MSVSRQLVYFITSLFVCQALFSKRRKFFLNFFNFFQKFFILLQKRREWDSNPRALADKRFSRPPRYDHFDISPYTLFNSVRPFCQTQDVFYHQIVFDIFVNTNFYIFSITIFQKHFSKQRPDPDLPVL